MKYRAVLIRPKGEVGEKHDQTFHTEIKSAEKWAISVLKGIAKEKRAQYHVMIYIRTEAAYGQVLGADID